MSKVVLVKCETYEYTQVRKAVQRGFDLLGGVEKFVKKDEKIVLKPNWLMAVAPEKFATTHPSLFKAVAEILINEGVVVQYGDSPGFSAPETASHKTGFTPIAAELGLTLADFQNGREVTYDKGIQNKKFFIANGVLDSDGIISLPKLKTHGFLKLTGSVKNQLGCIPGALKGEYHVKLPNPVHFAKMLVDLNACIKPRLYIMDGIIAMEGNGPMGGDPKKMNVILMSEDPVALDATVCRMIGVDPVLSFTVKFGKEAGLGNYLENEIELSGDALTEFIDLKFNINRDPIAVLKIGGSLVNFFSNTFVPKPVIMKEKCVKCGICVKMCPVNPKAVDWHNGDNSIPPSYKYDRCIRCYCCQEVCPESAIKLKVPFMRKIFGKRRIK